MGKSGNISASSRRIANNTILLYFRMFLLMFVGLFTSRVILQTLGKADFGTYNVVAGVVMMFTVFTNSISTAISRFITSELGKGDNEKLKRVFATSVVVQIILSLFIFLLVETIGVWFLHNKMNIPEGRMEAAGWVLQCAMVQMMISLFSVPYNATIMAHEHMKAYAYISILEAVLKFTVAVLLYFSGFDKLKTYAVLMVGVSIIVRMTYNVYCHKHFKESRTRPRFDAVLLREMFGFASWNFVSSGVIMFNTQGLNILTNLFFGVLFNAARGVAAQVENIVKQFVFNVVNAINPQITKSYASDKKGYSFHLVSRGMKYTYLIMLFFLVPTLFEAQTILEIWLSEVPENAALFTKLMLICVLLDVFPTTGSTLILADGRIKNFYLITSAISVLIFPLVWLAFRSGAPASSAYVIYMMIYVVVDFIKIIIIHMVTGYPYKMFFHKVLNKIVWPTVISIPLAALVVILLPDPTWWRAFLTVAVSSIAILVSSYFFVLTDGEREFIDSKLSSNKK